MIYKSFDQVNTDPSWDTVAVQDDRNFSLQQRAEAFLAEEERARIPWQAIPDPRATELEDMKYLIVMAMDKIAALEREVAALKQQKAAAPEQQLKIPLPSGITKLHFQLFENFRKPEKEQVTTQAKVQFKVCVWAPDKIKGYWLVPVHRPDRTRGRQRIPQLMQTVRDLGQDYICYAGGRKGDLEVYIDHNHKLMVRLGGDWQDHVSPPHSKPSDAAKNAPEYDWYCDVVAIPDRLTKQQSLLREEQE